MTLTGQPGGDGPVIKTLARQVKEPGLHLSAAGQEPMGMHRGLDLEIGDFAAAPDDANADPVGGQTPQNDFVDQTAEQQLLALARHVGVLPKGWQLRGERQKTLPVFSRQHLRRGAGSPVPGQQVLGLTQLA